MHWKNSMTRIPERVYSTRIGGICERGRVGRTIENRSDEESSETSLLRKVLAVWDLWSVRIIGPRSRLSIGHGPDVYEGGLD